MYHKFVKKIMNSFTVLLCFTLLGAVFSNVIPVPEALSGIEGRIAGGTPANIGQFPYIASLQNPTHGHFCGASIISNTWVITTASCTSNRQPTSFTVRVGSIVTTAGGAEHAVALIRPHAQYVPQTRANDIALVSTATPIQFNLHTSPIAISTIVHGVVGAVVAGWGEVAAGTGNSQSLYFLNTQTMTNFACQQAHSASGLASLVQATNICSFTTVGQGVCTGDSGNALAIGHSLIGVVSWASGCGSGYPDVYTRISSYHNWILQNTA